MSMFLFSFINNTNGYAAAHVPLQNVLPKVFVYRMKNFTSNAQTAHKYEKKKR